MSLVGCVGRPGAYGYGAAALTFVPVPGLKDAFAIASKLLFKG